MSVCDQKRDIIALSQSDSASMTVFVVTYLHRFPSKDKEGLRALGEKSGKLVHQNVLNLVCLLYAYADSDTVDAWFNEHLLIFVAGDGERIEQDFWRAGSLDFRHIVSFRGLRSEVREGESSGKRGSDALKVRAQ